VLWLRWCHPPIPTGREDRGGGDTIRGHGTGEEASGPGNSESFKAIFPVPVGSNLTREVLMHEVWDGATRATFGEFLG